MEKVFGVDLERDEPSDNFDESDFLSIFLKHELYHPKCCESQYCFPWWKCYMLNNLIFLNWWLEARKNWSCTSFLNLFRSFLWTFQFSKVI